MQDFAGQEIYLTTHQFFLTRRSIYLVVFNLMDEKSSKVEYWLKTLKSRARDSLVVIVGTHRDDKRCDKRYREQVIRRMRQRYDARFPFIKDYICVSCKTGKGIDALKSMLVSLAAKHKHDDVPQSYLLLEGRLRAKRMETQVLSRKQFVNFAKECGVTDKQMVHCMDFMSDAGAIVYFSDDKDNSSTTSSGSVPTSSSDGLSDLVVLDPQWITNLMSTVITLKHTYAKDGLLPTEALPQIWKQYPREQYDWLLRLLERFEISHRLDPAVAADLVALSASASGGVTPLLGSSPPASRKSVTLNLADLPQTSTESDSSPQRRRPTHKKNRSGDLNMSAVKSAAAAGSNASGGTEVSNTLDTITGPDSFILVPSLLPERPDPTMLRDSWDGHREIAFSRDRTGGLGKSGSSSATASPASGHAKARGATSTPYASTKFNSIVGRRYRFKFLPLGFFSRLILRLLHTPRTRALYYWKSGIVIEMANQRALVEYNEIEYQLDFLVKIRKADPNLAPAMPNDDAAAADVSLIRILVESIETLVIGWYKLRPRVFVPCSHCLAAKYLRSSTESRFDEQQLMLYSYPKPYDKPDSLHAQLLSSRLSPSTPVTPPIAVAASSPRGTGSSINVSGHPESPPHAAGSGSPPWSPSTLPLDMSEMMTTTVTASSANYSSAAIPVPTSHASTILDVNFDPHNNDGFDGEEDAPAPIVPYFFPIEECTLAVREGTTSLVCCRLLRPTNVCCTFTCDEHHDTDV
jgi:hypothetical protein